MYSLVAVSMNLLNGFTGLFSLGQAGFMLLGAYAYAHPHASRSPSVRACITSSTGPTIQFSLPEMFAESVRRSGFGGA